MFLTFVKSQPPLSVFLLCLFSLSLLAFSFSIRVSVSDAIRNPDVIDFDGIFERIARLDFCVEGEKQQNGREKRNVMAVVDEIKLEKSNSSRGSVSVLVPFSAEFVSNLRGLTATPDSIVLARGVVLLDHMKRASFGKYNGKHLEITMALPSKEPSLMEVDAAATQDVCVRIESPMSILDDLALSREKPANCTLPSEDSASTTAVLEFISHTKEKLPHEWCAGDNDTRYEEEAVRQIVFHSTHFMKRNYCLNWQFKNHILRKLTFKPRRLQCHQSAQAHNSTLNCHFILWLSSELRKEHYLLCAY
jgi:hypothetical protein